MNGESLSEIFLDDPTDDIFSVVEAWELRAASSDCNNGSFEFNNSINETEVACKRQKLNASEDGQHRTSHITVERNRRKQMNEHIAVLRSLMPCFYVKRVCLIIS